MALRWCFPFISAVTQWMDMSQLHSDRHQHRASVRNIELRRAVLRVLLRARSPLSVADIVRTLETDDRIAIADHHVATPSQRVSNLLGWQVRRGRVRRIGHGTYEAVPEAIPRTTRWRIERWDELD